MFLLSILIAFILFPHTVYAQVDCCSVHGGNYACDFSTHQLYCKDGTVSTSCSCTQQNTPTPTTGPTATLTPSPTVPSCPNFASFDPASKSCKCQSGYIVNDNACVSDVEYCWIKYGGNAAYNTDKNACTCSQGYVWNSDSTQCISFSQLCQDKLGSKSYYNSDSNSCTCYNGYVIQNNSCQIIPTHEALKPQKTSIVIPTNTPIPTVAPTYVPTLTDKPRNATPTFGLKPLGKNFSVTTIKTQPNFFIRFIKALWEFIRSLL